jgi:hypothetical protein
MLVIFGILLAHAANTTDLQADHLTAVYAITADIALLGFGTIKADVTHLANAYDAIQAVLFFTVRTPVVLMDMLVAFGAMSLCSVVTAVQTIHLSFAHVVVIHAGLTAHAIENLAVKAHIMVFTEEVLIVEITYIAPIAEPHTVTAIGNAMVRLTVNAKHIRSVMRTVFFAYGTKRGVRLVTGIT